MDKKTRTQIIGLLGLIVLIALGSLTGAKIDLDDATPKRTFAEGSYTVERVIDGDTFTIRQSDKELRVRLIGIDTPETVDPRAPVECFGVEASSEAKRILDGQRVRLETDSSQDTYDKYGRLLAYAYLPDGTLFNEYMIAEGYGTEYTFALPYKYQDEFKQAERDARAEKKGLWADNACPS